MLRRGLSFEAERVIAKRARVARDVSTRVDPVLIPFAGLRVVEVDALAAATYLPAPVLEDAATFRDRLDQTRSIFPSLRIEDVPFADPEIELPASSVVHAWTFGAVDDALHLLEPLVSLQ